MKTFLPSLLLFLCSSVLIAQVPCENGMAGAYPCNGLDLMATFSLGQLGGSSGNDSWGWTDPDDGKEYAITGLNNGTVFIDISDPINPVILGNLPTHTSNSSWRDMKVYNNHVFIVSEASNHGMQVFDLTRLRSVANPPVTFTEDAHYNGFGGAHNIVINEETGYAYAVGTNTFNGGPHFVNIQNPTSPTAAGGYSLDGYTHDAQVVIYDGPDTDYTGREIYFGSNTDELVIVDVTDKGNPTHIASTGYTNIGYTHQGWLTEDKSFFVLGDEADESNVGFNTRSIIIDLSDLDSPFADFEYFGPHGAIDHNGYVVGGKFYLANYTAGLRVIDISDIENQNMVETAYFDTHPASNSTTFSGAWNVYPYFASGNIIISNLDGGFFIVRDPNLAVNNNEDITGIILYPNPAQNTVTISSKTIPLNKAIIYNLLGQQVLNFDFSESLSENIDISSLAQGMYVIQLNNNITKRLIVN